MTDPTPTSRHPASKWWIANVPPDRRPEPSLLCSMRILDAAICDDGARLESAMMHVANAHGEEALAAGLSTICEAVAIRMGLPLGAQIGLAPDDGTNLEDHATAAEVWALRWFSASLADDMPALFGLWNVVHEAVHAGDPDKVALHRLLALSKLLGTTWRLNEPPPTPDRN